MGPGHRAQRWQQHLSKWGQLKADYLSNHATAVGHPETTCRNSYCANPYADWRDRPDRDPETRRQDEYEETKRRHEEYKKDRHPGQ